MGSYILQIVVILLVFLGAIFWKYSGIADKWSRALVLPFIIVAAGTPIIFTSLTRSVFEVSKLLNLRLALIAVGGIYLSRAIIEKNISFHKNPINWALLAFGLVNIFSALFSDNHYVAILGAYDRWEGLITEFNYIIYMFLFINVVKNKQAIYWMMGTLLGSAIFSGAYGISQSFGLDFMNWSADAAPRAFACINNPVHYAPYIIMHIPLLAGMLFHVVRVSDVKTLDFYKGSIVSVENLKKNKLPLFIILQLFCLGLLFYGGPLISFGRAAWIGFAFSLSFLLYFLLTQFNTSIIKDFFFIMYGNFLINYLYVFKVQDMHPALLFLALLLGIGYVIFIFINLSKIKTYITYSLLVAFSGLLQFATVSYQIALILIAIVGGIYFLSFKNDCHVLEAKLKLFFILALIVIPISLSYESLSSAVRFDIYKLRHPKPVEMTNWEYLNRLEKQGVINLSKKSKNTFSRTNSYSTQFGYNARISMWKSVFVWWLDGPKNFLLGTGPGTIKEMYPVYRRADYGRLEGGQNFTPDKVHNDYFNMLATRGLLGFVSYYLWLIPLGFFLILRKIKEEGFGRGNYLLAGLFAGMFAYLGQVLFNFGVVATRVIFYEFFCLALVIVFHDPFSSSSQKEVSVAEESLPKSF